MMLATGQLLWSPSGRALSPVPKIDTVTNGKTLRTLARIDQWLVDEARREALARRERADQEAADAAHKLALLGGIDPRRLTDCDRAWINEYLGLLTDGVGR